MLKKLTYSCTDLNADNVKYIDFNYSAIETGTNELIHVISNRSHSQYCVYKNSTMTVESSSLYVLTNHQIWWFVNI